MKAPTQIMAWIQPVKVAESFGPKALFTMAQESTLGNR